MRQRAMIAMALACRPQLLIADEPTTALDVTIQAQILDLMLTLQDEAKMSIQFISHNLAVVSEVAHSIMVMYAGKAVEYAPSDDLFANPLHPYTQGLIANSAGSRQAGEAPVRHSRPRNVRHHSRLPFRRPLSAGGRGMPPDGAGFRGGRAGSSRSLSQGWIMTELLTLDRIHVDIPLEGGFLKPKTVLQAVNDVSLTVSKGETLALVGESGSGKTTLGYVVAGLRKQTAGTVTIGGSRANADGRPPVQVIFQDPFSALDPRMVVGEIVAEPLRLKGVASKARLAKAIEVLGQVGLPPEAAGRYPHQFSGGQRQRIAIARAFDRGTGNDRCRRAPVCPRRFDPESGARTCWTTSSSSTGSAIFSSAMILVSSGT